jgi:hypothetical protein
VLKAVLPNVLMAAFGFCVSRISKRGEQLTASVFTGIEASCVASISKVDLLGGNYRRVLALKLSAYVVAQALRLWRHAYFRVNRLVWLLRETLDACTF